MDHVLDSLSPLSTPVHDDFSTLTDHAEGHLHSSVDEALSRVAAVGGDDDDESPVNGLVIPSTLGGDDEDDPIAHLTVSVNSDPSQVLHDHHHHHGLSGLGNTGVVGEEGEIQHNTALTQSGNVVTLEDGQLVQAAQQEGILLTTDADGNLAMPIQTENVIRFFMQTSDGNVVTANAPVDAIKFSMPGLLGGEAGDIAQTVQAVTLPDGTTTLITSSTKEATGHDETVALPKFVEGQTIKLEDGTTAVLQATPPEVMNEGIQAIQLEDGSTAFIAQSHAGALFPGAVHQLDTSLHLQQLANQQALLAPVERQSEKALVIGDKAYKCEYEHCGRLYTTHHHLKVHERSHTGDRPFQCEFANCGKTFATGYGLKSHNRVHTGEKPYPCPHTDKGCEKAFKTSGDLQKHVRTHTGERPFKCPFEGCTQSFTTSNIRKVHIRTHTGERPYICDVEGCGRAFASATNYKNHIRIHTGEKPYVCSVLGCGKRFTEYSSLYKHHVVHTHTKPYTCHCGKTYRQTSTLAMHKRTAHGEETVLLPGESDMSEADEPPAKMIKREVTDAESTDQSTRVLIGDGSQMILIAQSSTVTATTSTSNDSIGTTSTTTTPTNQDENTVGEDQIQQQKSHEQEQDQQMAGLLSLQQNGLNLADLANLQSLQGLHGLPGLAMTEGGQQVLVVTDPAQLEMLQQFAQGQGMLQYANVVASSGAEDVDVKPLIGGSESYVVS